MRGLFAGVAAGYLQLALSIASQFILVPVLLDAAGKDLSGVYLILLTIANVAAIGVGWMITPAQRRMIRDDLPDGPGPAVAHALLWWTLVAYALLFGLAAAASCLLVGTVVLSGLDATQLATVRSCILGLACFVLFSFAAQADLALLGARLRQAEANLLRAGVPALFLAGLLTFVAMEWTRVDALMWMNAGAAAAVFALVRRRVLGRWCFIQPRPTLAQARDVLGGEGRRYLVFSGLQFALLYGDIFLIGVILGPAEVAEYVVVWRIAEAAITLLIRIPETLGPYLSTTQAQGRREELARTSMGVLRAMLALAVALIVVYAAAGPTLSAWWVGPQHLSAPTWCFVAAAVMAGSLVFNRTQIAMHAALGEVHTLIPIMLCEWACKGFAAIFLSITFGVEGVFIAGAISHVLASAWYWRSTSRACSVSTSHAMRSVFAPAALSGAAAICLYLLASLFKIPLVLAALFASIPCLLLSWVFTLRFVRANPIGDK